MKTIEQLTASLKELKAEKANNSKQLTEAQVSTLNRKIKTLRELISRRTIADTNPEKAKATREKKAEQERERRKNNKAKKELEATKPSRRQTLKLQNPAKAKAASEKEAAQKRDRRKANKDLQEAKAKEAQAKIDQRNERRREKYQKNNNKMNINTNTNTTTNNNNTERSARASPPTPIVPIGVDTPASGLFSSASRYSSGDLPVVDPKYIPEFLQTLKEDETFSAGVHQRGIEERKFIRKDHLKASQEAEQRSMQASKEAEQRCIEEQHQRTALKLAQFLSPAAESVSRTATLSATGQGMSSQDWKPAAGIGYSNDSNCNITKTLTFDDCTDPQVYKASEGTTMFSSSLKKAPPATNGAPGTQSGKLNAPPGAVDLGPSSQKTTTSTPSSKQPPPATNGAPPTQSGKLNALPGAVDLGQNFPKTPSSGSNVPKATNATFSFGEGKRGASTFGQQTPGTGDGGLNFQKPPSSGSFVPKPFEYGEGQGIFTYGKQSNGSVGSGFASVQQPPAGTGGGGAATTPYTPSRNKKRRHNDGDDRMPSEGSFGDGKRARRC